MIDDILTQDQCLVIVRSLNDYHGELNESVFQDCLEAYGHKVSRACVRVLLAWLAKQDLLRLDTLPGGYLVAHLCGSGQEVAEGRATVLGVKKPRRR
ncbi:hypothetical protein SGGMMB4_00784 [Sodalis glossinidius str. 'morsitans']|uniref:ArsR family transcriptional regulator n=1 Tax=Sodalis glossinidius (strain morsitans) TaxID=343509 RepID=Q2NW78_SODGM|nr:hypothetical protein [Sodalis glossinidius]BAE73597.1 conserved hypothetical protein [Sodalis glossinidius str. 'morsitans']CRL43983.1 hypothetical protein SGGMMB4_00784 [Sodalis glossinidius str. 'morsitans']